MIFNQIYYKNTILKALGVFATASILITNEVKGSDYISQPFQSPFGYFMSMPPDCKIQTISYLPIKETSRLASVSKELKKIVYNMVYGHNNNEHKPHDIHNYVESFFSNNIYKYVNRFNIDGEYLSIFIRKMLRKIFIPHTQTLISNITNTTEKREYLLDAIELNHLFENIDIDVVIKPQILRSSSVNIRQDFNLNRNSLFFVNINQLFEQKETLYRVFEHNPNLCLIIETDKNELSLSNDDLPSTIRYLSFIGTNVTSINSKFLKRCYNLKHVNLYGLTNLKTIGEGFLFLCKGLVSLDLNPLSRVTRIYSEFLYGCQNLTSIDLSPLANVTEIKRDFLHNCGSLSTIDLAPLTNIKSIPDCCFQLCYKLREINIEPLLNITKIECGFLYGNNTIKKINFRGTPNVTSIGNSFMYSCTSLNIIDLNSLYQVTHIGYEFLNNCKSLNTIDLTPFSNIKDIGYGFLSGCSGLNSIDLSPLSNLTKIEWSFLSRCTGLTELDLSPLCNVNYIGAWFLSNCSSLTELDLSPLTNVISVENYFLSNCKSLTKILLSSYQREGVIHKVLKDNNLDSKIDFKNDIKTLTL